MLIDSHCHLNNSEFKEDLSEIIRRAKALDVGMILNISTDLLRMHELEALSDQESFLYHTVGVHPDEVDTLGVPTVENLLSFTAHPKAIGIGETGLDYYYENSHRELQQKSFRNHIRASRESGLPLIIHSRAAEEDILTILKEEGVSGEAPGVIHCFTGTEPFAKAVLEMGFYISISGIVTFKNAEPLRQVVETVSLDRLLVETDAPYLAPMPYRGKRNEPSFVVHTAEKLAELKGVSVGEISRLTTENFLTLFSKVKKI
jgi:TatD DNase family protein